MRSPDQPKAVRQMIEAFINWYCKTFHAGFYWPMRGAAVCRTCHRKHALSEVK